MAMKREANWFKPEKTGRFPARVGGEVTNESVYTFYLAPWDSVVFLVAETVGLNKGNGYIG